MEYHYCPGHEVVSDLIKVGENDHGLLGSPSSDQPPDEDHRRIPVPRSCQKAAEVGIGGDQDAVLDTGPFEDRFIGCGLHAEVSNMDSVMPGRLQRVGEERRKVVVDEELHAVCRSGSSRSRTASAAYSSDS